MRIVSCFTLLMFFAVVNDREASANSCYYTEYNGPSGLIVGTQ